MGGCPACGSRVAPLAKFCSECGAALDLPTGRGPPAERAEGELRQLTALFCDLVGSTELSTRMDAEQFGELIHRYLGRAAEVVHGYEGDVARYLGDGILVHFGWPEAHDDDAERAVRAALDVVAEIEAMNSELPRATQLAVRIGIHTGPVMIGEIRGSSNQETISLGETLNLAARLQAVAPPNGVALSAATRDLVRGIFVLEDLGPQRLRGIPVPVEAFRAVQPTGIRSRLDATADRLTPLVGRTLEVATLMDLWSRVRSGFGGQAALIVGEPGVGKSRLVHELRIRLRDEPHSWLECRCSSYTRQSAFRPAVELIEHGLQLRRSDTPEGRLANLVRGLSMAGVDPRGAVELLAPLLSLPFGHGAGVEMSAERRRRRTIELLVEWLLALARPQPLILLAEDLHWSDPSSLELLGELMSQSSAARLLIVATARPEFAPPWPAESGLEVIRAEPLSERDAREMVAELASGGELPEAVMSRIVSETDGIPLFIEEIGRMALESSELRQPGAGTAIPGADFQIPSSLQASLMARLDRLSAAKGVAQRAAVIGREFRYELLEEVADLEPEAIREGLDRLVESDLLFEVGEGASASYAFKHALIQDAAYQSLLRRTRARLHGRIAEALERGTVDMDVTPEVVARHFEAAGRTESAMKHYGLAAAQAANSSGYREAIAHLRKGIELVAQLPAERARDEAEMEMQLELASSIMATRSYADPVAQTAYERALALGEALGDRVGVGYALTGLSISHSNQGDVQRGEELAERVLEIAAREHDDTLELLARVQLALPACYQGRFEQALEHAEAAIAVYDRDRHRSVTFRFGTDHGVAGHAFAALSLVQLGYPERARARIQGARELAASLAQPFNVAFAIAGEIMTLWLRGDHDALESAGGELAAISEEQGFDLFLGMGRMSRAAARALSSGDPAAIPEMMEGSAIAARTGTRGGIPALLCLIAESHRAVGDHETAAGTVEGALAIAADTRQLAWDARLLVLKGDLHADVGEGREAEDCFRRALAIARPQAGRLEELRATTRLARLLHGRDEDGKAAELLAVAYKRFPETCAIADLEEARELLDGVRSALAVRH